MLHGLDLYIATRTFILNTILLIADNADRPSTGLRTPTNQLYIISVDFISASVSRLTYLLTYLCLAVTLTVLFVYYFIVLFNMSVASECSLL